MSLVFHARMLPITGWNDVLILYMVRVWYKYTWMHTHSMHETSCVRKHLVDIQKIFFIIFFSTTYNTGALNKMYGIICWNIFNISCQNNVKYMQRGLKVIYLLSTQNVTARFLSYARKETSMKINFDNRLEIIYIR